MTFPRKTPLLLAGGFVFAVGLRLFTYEFHLADDPSCGVALRSWPSLVQSQRFVPGDRVLLEDENSFLGERLYRAFIGWGWLVFASALLVSRFSLRAKNTTDNTDPR